MKTHIKIWDGVIYKNDCLNTDFVNYVKQKYGCFRSGNGTIILDDKFAAHLKNKTL